MIYAILETATENYEKKKLTQSAGAVEYADCISDGLVSYPGSTLELWGM